MHYPNVMFSYFIWWLWWCLGSQRSALDCWWTGWNCCVRRLLEVPRCLLSHSCTFSLGDGRQMWVGSRPRAHRRRSAVAPTYLPCLLIRAAGQISAPLLFYFLNLVPVSTSNEAYLICIIIVWLLNADDDNFSVWDEKLSRFYLLLKDIYIAQYWDGVGHSVAPLTTLVSS